MILVGISLLQIIVGVFKGFVVTFLPVKVLVLHGKLGYALYVLALTAVCTGVQLTLEEEIPEDYYYYPPSYYQYYPDGTNITVTPPPELVTSNLVDLKDYAIVIYILTGVLAILVIFYDHFMELPWEDREQKPKESTPEP